MKEKNLKPKTHNLNTDAFTLIELLLVIAIIGTLTAIVVANFQRIRTTQQLQNGVFDLVSNLRRIQTFTLSGYEVSPSGEPAEKYEIVFTSGSQNYAVNYVINSATSTLETAALPESIEVSDILLEGSPLSAASFVIYAPFGRFTAEGGSFAELELELSHTVSGETGSVIINGISGRITEK